MQKRELIENLSFINSSLCRFVSVLFFHETVILAGYFDILQSQI